LAADLGAGAPAAYTKAPAYEPVSNWTGLYIGGNVGYGWGNGNTDVTNLPSQAISDILNATLHDDPKGVIGGGQIGYNWQIGSIVTGLEADIQGSGIHGSSSAPLINFRNGNPFNGFAFNSDQKLSWFGTVRGRLGVTVTPSLLLYGTGGLAYGQVQLSGVTTLAAPQTTFFPASLNTTKAGWTAGGGAEWMFTRGWSAKVEYLHIDLGNVSATSALDAFGDGTNYRTHAQYDTVRFGVNYHFN
jgi:outer membrane immunogenic protein